MYQTSKFDSITRCRNRQMVVGGGKGKSGRSVAPKLGMTVRKEDNYGLWYQQLVVEGELVEYTDVSGCFVLRPWAYFIWSTIQEWFDREILARGVENCYFPLFVKRENLAREEEHVEGFAAEVAWITKHGEKDMEEPIALRPTSETIMYPMYSKWIKSHRDLPLKLNQWSNIVRWEFTATTPFIRTREFLWQEGHTAWETQEEALAEMHDILRLYERIYEELLAVPVIRGEKSVLERFPGGARTLTVEGFVPDVGRGVQGGTSHHLGQNFAKMFDVTYLDREKKRKHVFQNSWGLSTRAIGLMLMQHSDNRGLVLPPRVARLQVVIVPIYKKPTYDVLDNAVAPLVMALTVAGVRVRYDDRNNYNPGWKYAHWELKGVPLRLELGERDMATATVIAVRRDTGKKTTLAWADLPRTVPVLLDTIHNDMLRRARNAQRARIVTVRSWVEFMEPLEANNMLYTPWCEESQCEVAVKKASDDASERGKAKTLCIPLEQQPLPAGTPCFKCGKRATVWVLWGRSY